MKNNQLVINRLTALWALNESGLGGFLHVFNTPFTGLIVGGIAFYSLVYLLTMPKILGKRF